MFSEWENWVLESILRLLMTNKITNNALTVKNRSQTSHVIKYNNKKVIKFWFWILIMKNRIMMSKNKIKRKRQAIKTANKMTTPLMTTRLFINRVMMALNHQKLRLMKKTMRNKRLVKRKMKKTLTYPRIEF